MNKKVKKLIKIDGTNMYILGDLIYFDNENYTHFYKIEDAYNYYKSIGEALNKKVAFRFLENELYIDNKTTLEDLNKQLDSQKNIDDSALKNNEVEKMYKSYLLIKNDVVTRYPSVKVKK